MSSLAGVKIAVTRAAAQSEELALPLERAGAVVHRCPLIRTEPYEMTEQMRSVIRGVDAFDWLVFTSVNGVEQFFRLAEEVGVDVQRVLRSKKLAAVGPATAAALTRKGLSVAAIPAAFLGDAVSAALAAHDDLSGRRVLIARASGGGQALPEQLRDEGADVVDLEIYRSVVDATGADRLRALLASGEIDLLTFTSGSAVRNFVDTVSSEIRTPIAVIGPSTAQVARACGLAVDVEADPHTIDGLVNAILAYYAARGGHLEV